MMDGNFLPSCQMVIDGSDFRFGGGDHRARAIGDVSSFSKKRDVTCHEAEGNAIALRFCVRALLGRSDGVRKLLARTISYKAPRRYGQFQSYLQNVLPMIPTY